MEEKIIKLRGGYNVKIRGENGEKITMEVICETTGLCVGRRTFNHKDLTGEPSLADMKRDYTRKSGRVG